MTVPRTLANDGAGEKLQLLVVEGDSVTVHDLPERGSVLIGRGAGVDVQLADPSASTRHARLHIEDGSIAIEDLASRNGTQLRGQRIPAEERSAIAPGEAALLGSAVLLVQRKSGRAPERRCWPHSSFEMRLAEECDTSRAGGATFSVARLDLEQSISTQTFMEAAAVAVRPSDIVGSYGPNAFELLLRRTASEVAERAIVSLLEQLRLRGAKARCSLAHFPVDGQTADALIERACAGVRQTAADATPPGVIVIDPQLRKLYGFAEKAAAGTINVLLLGETGVGKEVLARDDPPCVQARRDPSSASTARPWRPALLESELFGHEKGAFTGAVARRARALRAGGRRHLVPRRGRRSAAGVQVKLLRVLEERAFERVGGMRHHQGRRPPHRRHEQRPGAGDRARSGFAPISSTASTACARDPAAPRPPVGDPTAAARLSSRSSSGNPEHQSHQVCLRMRSPCWRPTPGPATSASCAT